MSSFTLVSYVAAAQDLEWSHITDLSVVTVGGQDLLYSATRYDGVLRSWAIDGGLRALTDDAFSGVLRAGGTSSISTLDLGTGTGILTGGGAAGALQIQAISSNGTFGTPTSLGQLPDMYDSLHHTTVVDLANGQQVVYGGLVGANGIGSIRFSSTGDYHSTRFISDTSTTFGRDITGMDSATVNGNTYLLSLSAQDNGITSWGVGTSGQLNAVHSMGVDDALWTHAPSALAVATVGPETFVIIAAAGSGTLSVMQISPNGQLTLRDHILDDRNSRFDDVSAMDVISHQGQTYVVAGGSDDGISIFQILPGGQLVARGHLADTTAMGLANPSAISLRSNGNNIDIFVASSAETGVTHLTFHTGPAGQTIDAASAGSDVSGAAGNDVISGLGGNDILRGQNGDDILRDGGGSDVMVGGAGADLFVLAYDAQVDTINDFVVGEDRIDLSGWPMLRDISQLTMVITGTGMTITYGDERLVIRSATGTPIDHRTIDGDDLIGGARIPEVILPGYAGPNRPAPSLPNATTSSENTPDDPETIRGTTLTIGFGSPQIRAFNGQLRDGSGVNNLLVTGDRNDRLVGRGGNDRIDAGGGSDRIFGGSGNDVILGRSGDDWAHGGDGADLIFSGGGNDVVLGWSGNDDINGGFGDDQIFGQAGHDRIQGYNGNDRLDGGDGNNRMYGQSGDDRLIAGSGQDMLYGGGGNDLIAGRTGHDRIEGGTGHDKLLGGSGNDTLTGQQDEDHLEGSYGNDFLFGGGGDDFLAGQQGRDRLEGGEGRDRIYGGGGDDILTGRQDDDFLHGGIGSDLILGGGGRDTLDGFDGDDRLEGNEGNDSLIGGNGADVLAGQQDNDWLHGGNGNDQLHGGAGQDTLIGHDGNDQLFGNDGNDELFGGNGDDLLYANDGRNTLSGDAGNDQMFGGNGLDTFIFTGGADVIHDIQENRDQLAIDVSLWDGTLAPSDLAFLFGSLNDDGMAFDFGNGNSLQINGITDMSVLDNYIDFV